MPLDRLRKSLEGLPKPTLGEVRSLEDLLKPPPVSWKIHSTLAYLEEHYQAALDHARKCNVFDTLDELISASDSGHSLGASFSDARRDRLFTQEEYMDAMVAIDDFLTFGLPEDVAKALLDKCECKEK